MIQPDVPALVLAPMEGITDAPMRAYQGATGCFTYAVSEFLRVNENPLPPKVFKRDVPELLSGTRTPTGLPVQIQILGGNATNMAISAVNAVRAGATAIDINFGCPAKTVNRNDGGASLLKHPLRIKEIVKAVREAVPSEIPISAKIRLGWEDIEDVYENATMAAVGGASWITIHARTRMQGYLPPVFWKPIGRVREMLSLPIVANGDIWNIDDFRQCREETGCIHYMIGRGALANPRLALQVSHELGLSSHQDRDRDWQDRDWIPQLHALEYWTSYYKHSVSFKTMLRLKQWLKFAAIFGEFRYFESVKQAQTLEEFFARLEQVIDEHAGVLSSR